MTVPNVRLQSSCSTINHSSVLFTFPKKTLGEHSTYMYLKTAFIDIEYDHQFIILDFFSPFTVLSLVQHREKSLYSNRFIAEPLTSKIACYMEIFSKIPYMLVGLCVCVCVCSPIFCSRYLKCRCRWKSSFW